MNIIGIIGGIIVIGVYLLIIGICIADYIITSKALYFLAKRRNIERAWLAWIPFIKNAVIGCLAENYEKRNSIKHNWSTVLFILTAISVIGIFAIVFIIIVASIALSISRTEPSVLFSIIIIIAYIGYILALIAIMLLNILRAICIFKIYESTVPKKSLKYMILSIAVPLGEAICLYKCKDKGYPEPVIINEKLSIEGR